MHRSRLAGFIIDCKDTEPTVAAQFWGAALGMAATFLDGPYQDLDASARDLHIEVQNVAHESRVHLDIETDDMEAEVKRLEALGARRVGPVKRWVVMEAPTGQRFCVVLAKQDLAGAAGVTRCIGVFAKRCFQVMETEDRVLLDEWMANWSDLVDFEVHPVITSQEAAQTMASREAAGEGIRGD